MDTEQLKNLLYVSIISADNNEYGLTEDEKQQIISRHQAGEDWDYTLQPIKDENLRNALVKLLSA